MDLVAHIYHETQEPGSMLCGQHALNNLLQQHLFEPTDLADIARRLDQLEADQLDEEEQGAESNNYDDSGFFSIMVMEEALKVLGLRLVRWKSQELADAHDNPERMEGFVLNHQLHWYTIRRFGLENRWYNLDSCVPAPTWISPMFLGLTLREAELQGYSILAVVPTSEALITGLPACPASTLAPTLAPPTSSSSTYHSSSTTPPSFAGRGNVLGSTSSSTAGPSRSKRRQSSPPQGAASPSGDSGTSSVEEESEKRRRRPRLGEQGMDAENRDEGEREMTEEDMMAIAIAESLRASSLEDSGKEEEDGEGTGWEGKKKEGGEKEEKRGKSRAEEDEEREFEAALKASLEESGGASASAGGSGSGKDEPDAEDDSPSVEELRRRRLARFG